MFDAEMRDEILTKSDRLFQQAMPGISSYVEEPKMVQVGLYMKQTCLTP